MSEGNGSCKLYLQDAEGALNSISSEVLYSETCGEITGIVTYCRFFFTRMCSEAPVQVATLYNKQL
jgi:hypothetical protein